MVQIHGIFNLELVDRHIVNCTINQDLVPHYNEGNGAGPVISSQIYLLEFETTLTLFEVLLAVETVH